MSSLSNKVDVLIVGAGPTGLLTAMELARVGIEVEIVDRAWRSAAQSYACGLHASSVGLLDRLGLRQAAVDAGIRVDSFAFYDGPERRAGLDFSRLPGPFPFLLVLPQDQLEEFFEEQLRALGIRVRWGHRLDDLRQDENAVSATVEKLGVTSVGYPFARSEETVETEIAVRARFVVGADGAASHVRGVLGIETERVRPATAFEVFEFAPHGDPGKEVRVTLNAGGTDSYWPQPGCMGRWSLQVSDGEDGHPEKERNAFVVLDESADEDTCRTIERRIRARAPWFDAGVREVDWSVRVGFQSMMARSFGRGRCWLVGDAGHQTGPAGMQSMNVGLREAADLADRLRRILREGASRQLLEEYDRARQGEWSRLLGAHNGLQAGPKATEWTRANLDRLLPCLPGSGSELASLAAQLEVSFTAA